MSLAICNVFVVASDVRMKVCKICLHRDLIAHSLLLLHHHDLLQRSSPSSIKKTPETPIHISITAVKVRKKLTHYYWLKKITSIQSGFTKRRGGETYCEQMWGRLNKELPQRGSKQIIKTCGISMFPALLSGSFFHVSNVMLSPPTAWI